MLFPSTLRGNKFKNLGLNTRKQNVCSMLRQSLVFIIKSFISGNEIKLRKSIYSLDFLLFHRLMLQELQNIYKILYFFRDSLFIL